MPDRKIGVVFVSWQIPEHRLLDHFRWNGDLYEAYGVHVFVVREQEPTDCVLPDYVTCINFPDKDLPLIHGKRLFALTRTKNAGLKAAIDAGCELIICTDVDVAFEPDAWQRGLTVATADVPTAFNPVCRMSWSSNWDKRRGKYVTAGGATGIVVMTAADWGRVSFCEKQWGYGGDDGAVVKRILAAGIRIDRGGLVYHMAHIDGTPQREFDPKNPRRDHWNRKNGLNPENFAHNNRFVRGKAGA